MASNSVTFNGISRELVKQVILLVGTVRVGWDKVEELGRVSFYAFALPMRLHYVNKLNKY